MADGDRAFNLSWHDWLNLKNLIEVSRVIASSALAREDSRGAHYREDHPETDDLASSSYIVVQRQGPGLETRRESVRFTRVAPGQTILADASAPSLPLNSKPRPAPTFEEDIVHPIRRSASALGLLAVAALPPPTRRRPAHIPTGRSRSSFRSARAAMPTLPRAAWPWRRNRRWGKA